MTNLDRRQALIGGGTLAFGAALAFGRSSPASAADRTTVRFSPAEWKRRLGPDRYRILRQAGTEAPFSSPLDREKRRGTFHCAGCDLPLFSSKAKFDSGTGWPSFTSALPNAIRTRRDGALGLWRVEEYCRRCGGHLGHVFDDGPAPTGKRHCINGLALRFRLA